MDRRPAEGSLPRLHLTPHSFVQEATQRAVDLWKVLDPRAQHTLRRVCRRPRSGQSTCGRVCTPAATRTRSTHSPARVQEATQRTVDLWKGLYPGCMPAFTNLPVSMTASQFERKAALEKPPDKRHFLQRNAYTEHSEQAASTMKALISDKK